MKRFDGKDSLNEYNGAMLADSLELGPLRTLVAIARYGTLTEAARRLSLSQPAATHQIHQLERQLGMPVFERRGRRLALTEAGQLVLARATRLLAELEALDGELQALQGLTGGQVRIGGGATAIVHLLPALIGTFQHAHPGISFYLREGATAPITAAVAAGELDLGIVTLPCEQPGLLVEPWLEDRVHFVARPDAPLVGRQLSPSDLEGQPFVHAAPGMPLRQLAEGALQLAGVAPRVIMELQSIEAIKASVEEGLGYAALGERTVARELADGRLVKLDIAGFALRRRLGLIVRAASPLAPAVAAFLVHVREAKG